MVAAVALSLSCTPVYAGQIPCTFSEDGFANWAIFHIFDDNNNSIAFSLNDLSFSSPRKQSIVLSLADIPRNQKMNWDLLHVCLKEETVYLNYENDIVSQKPVLATIYTTQKRFTVTAILSFLFKSQQHKCCLSLTIPFSDPPISENLTEIFVYLSIFDLKHS